MINKELQQQIEQLEQQIKDLKVKLESKAEPIPYKPYEVKVPEDVETYYTINRRGELQSLNFYSDVIQRCIYRRGEAFELSDNAILYNKERLLLKRMEDWAYEHNEGWFPDWENENERKTC